MIDLEHRVAALEDGEKESRFWDSVLLNVIIIIFVGLGLAGLLLYFGVLDPYICGMAHCPPSSGGSMRFM